MEKITGVLLFLLLISISASSQKISGKLKFEQGQQYEITMNVKTKISQEAMGQAIDFNIDGTATHSYKVTNATDDNNTLHHQLHRITYIFDGMGQKRAFDSDKPKDLEGQFGKPIKDLLEKKYDMVIDSTGKVLMVEPEKFDDSDTDPRMAIIMNLLKDVVSTVQPPAKNEACFFKILPDTATTVGDNWTQTGDNGSGKFTINYKISDINDSTIVVNFTEASTTVTKAEMMGMETTTNLTNKTTGTIVLDRQTGIIKQKTSTTDSNGTTEAMGGTVPVTSKIMITINVKPVK